MKPKTFWAVMVNHELYSRSLCEKREWAVSYLGDAQHAAAPGAKVRIVKVVIEEVEQTDEEKARLLP